MSANDFAPKAAMPIAYWEVCFVDRPGYGLELKKPIRQVVDTKRPEAHAGLCDGLTTFWRYFPSEVLAKEFVKKNITR